MLKELQHFVEVTMITPQQVTFARQRAQDFLRNAGVALTESEQNSIEVADFGLGDLDRIGLEIVTYVNTTRCCAKELVLFPYQTCPEHRHPPIAGEPGKEETFRCRWGKVFLYVEGPRTQNPQAKPPTGREHTYTVWHEIELHPGDQHTVFPDTKHWFQAGSEGAVVSEFSTRSRDESDVFTDTSIVRSPAVAG